MNIQKKWTEVDQDQIVEIWRHTRNEEQILALARTDPQWIKKKRNMVIHYTKDSMARITNLIVQRSHKGTNQAKMTQVLKTLVITKTNITGPVRDIQSQVFCDHLMEITNFPSGVRVATKYQYPGSSIKNGYLLTNDNYSILAFSENGDIMPCKVNHIKLGQYTKPTEIDDIASFMLFYPPGNKDTMDLLVQYTTGQKVIKADFLNEPEKEKNRNLRRKENRSTLFHGKMVRVLITILGGSVDRIINSFKQAGALIGPESDVDVKSTKIVLNSHRWSPFPAALEKLTRMEEVKFITVDDRNNFTLHLNNDCDSPKILEALQISAVASSQHPSFVAEPNSPWAQININNTISIINKKYQNHTYIKKNYIYIAGFSAIYSRKYVEELLTAAHGNFSFDIVSEGKDHEKPGSITCQFLTTPYFNKKKKQMYTLEIFTNNTITMNGLKQLTLLNEQHNNKYTCLEQLNHELVKHSKINSAEDSSVPTREYEGNTDIFDDPDAEGYVPLRKREKVDPRKYTEVMRGKRKKTHQNETASARSSDKGDFDLTGDTLTASWLAQYNEFNNLEEDDKADLLQIVVNTLTKIIPNYGAKATLPPVFTSKTNGTEGIGPMIIKALKKKVEPKAIIAGINHSYNQNKNKKKNPV